MDVLSPQQGATAHAVLSYLPVVPLCLLGSSCVGWLGVPAVVRQAPWLLLSCSRAHSRRPENDPGPYSACLATIGVLSVDAVPARRILAAAESVRVCDQQ